MDLSEKHTRLRAHDDESGRIAFHQFVTEHFGGEYRRAVWFAQECADMAAAVMEPARFYSLRRGPLAFYSRR